MKLPAMPRLPWVVLGAALAVLLVFPLCRGAWAGELKSRHVRVVFENEDHFREFFTKLKPPNYSRALSPKHEAASGDPDEAAGEYLDTLLLLVQQVLQMPLKGLTVNITILPDQQAVWEAFQRLAKGPTATQQSLGVSSNSLPAFYFKQTNTIYIQTKMLKVGILAHEMGHCVTGRYFAIPPPDRVSELMSQFVDQVITAGRF